MAVVKTSAYLIIGHSDVISCRLQTLQYTLFPANIIQHKDGEEESQDTNSIDKSDH